MGGPPRWHATRQAEPPPPLPLMELATSRSAPAQTRSVGGAASGRSGAGSPSATAARPQTSPAHSPRIRSSTALGLTSLSRQQI